MSTLPNRLPQAPAGNAGPQAPGAGARPLRPGKPRTPLMIAQDLQKGLTAALPAGKAVGRENVTIQLSCLLAICGIQLTAAQRQTLAGGQTPTDLSQAQGEAMDELTSVLAPPPGQEYDDRFLFAPPPNTAARKAFSARLVQVNTAGVLAIVNALIASPPAWASVPVGPIPGQAADAPAAAPSAPAKAPSAPPA